MASEIKYPNGVYNIMLKESEKINTRQELREKIFEAIRKGDLFTLKECSMKMNKSNK